MKRLLTPPLAMLLIAGFASLALAPGSASAAGPTVISGSSSNASASFFSDVNGVQTSTFVYANDNTFSDLNGTFEGSDVFVDIFQFDPGNPNNPRDDQSQYFSGFASLAPDQFVMNGDLGSATLSAVVSVCEFTGKKAAASPPPSEPNCFDVTIDLTWDGTGTVATSSGRSNSRFDGCRIQSSFSNSYRSAVASGVVSDGTTDFAPNPADYGDLSTYRFQDKLSGDCFFPEPPK